MLTIVLVVLVICAVLGVAYLMRGRLREHFGLAPRQGWLYDLVDGVYCVTLTRRDERMSNARDFFASINVTPTYIDAIDRKHDLDLPNLMTDCDATGVCKLMPAFTLSGGEVACYLSHLKALRTFLDDRRNGRPCRLAVICEDDVKPVGPDDLQAVVNKMQAVMREAAAVDWNVINMGPCLSWCEARGVLGGGAATAFDGERSSSKCSHFIVVNRAGAEAILAHAFPIFNIPYDVKLNILARQHRIRMLEADVPLFTQNRERLKSELNHDDRLVHCGFVTPPARDYLVFSSVGNQSRWYDEWATPHRTYDIFVSYYGDDATRMQVSAMSADRLNVTSGGKFQNLYAWYHGKPELFGGYRYIAVLDDDIQMSGADIDRMFATADKLDLWVSQPSFSDDSKVSHEITKHEQGVSVAYTNFIEMNCPFFKADKLFEVLNSDKNDGTLFGYGTDFMYQDILGADATKYAVVHSVQCRNPRDNEKPDGREILKLASQDARVSQWESYRSRFGLRDVTPTVHSCVDDGSGLPMPGYCKV